MDPQPTLQTDRLILRPFTLDDAPAVRRLAGDPAIADTTLNIPHPYEAGMAEAWIETHPQQYEKGEGATFAIVRRADGVLVGAIGIHPRAKHDRAEIGYWIGKPYWGQGIATEAARAVVDYGFETLGLNRIYAYHFGRNPASGRVMQKLGMKYEGTLRQHVRNGEQYEDLATYGMLRDEWAERMVVDE
jgi:RimJ/RimL family protein N-acetyltransferase